MARTRTPLLFVAAFALVGAACSLLADTDGLSGGTPSSSSSSSSSSGQAPIGTGPDGGGGPADAAIEAAPAVGCPAAGHTCVAGPPDGWRGPLVFYDGPADTAPGCPSSMAVAEVRGNVTFSAPKHSCSPCTCANAGGVQCTATVEEFTDLACGTSKPDSTNELLLNTCRSLNGAAYKVTFKVSGSCSPGGGVPSLPPVTFGSTAVACGAPGLLQTGCPTGEVCTPEPTAPFVARHCIAKAGNVACPAGPYTERTLAVTSLADGRGCTACTCGAPQNTCAGTLQLATNGTCTNQVGSIAVPLTACTQRPGSADGAKLLNTNANAVSCPPAGGSPTGTVTADGVETICCAK